MSVIEDAKTLLDTGDDANGKLEIIKRGVVVAIKNYLNTDKTADEIEADYIDAVLQATIDSYRTRYLPTNIKSKGEGKVSTTLKDGPIQLSESVKALLPLPSIRLMG